MVIDILTLFPSMFSGPFSESIIKRAADRNIVKINLINIRDYGIGKHKSVDDKPYGGGVGMVMRVDVVAKAIESVMNKQISKYTNKQINNELRVTSYELRRKVILLDPKGKTYNQAMVRRFSKLDQLILICGHYEGVDERVKKYVDESISIGDYILTGGEIPGMAIVDSVVRLLPGVLLKLEATEYESFSSNSKLKTQNSKPKLKSQNYLEYPQYTRPEVFRGQKVPEVLLSGDHQKVEEWKKKMTGIK